MKPLENLTVGELYTQLELMDRRGDTEFKKRIEAELKNRDTGGYEYNQAEIRFGA